MGAGAAWFFPICTKEEPDEERVRGLGLALGACSAILQGTTLVDMSQGGQHWVLLP